MSTSVGNILIFLENISISEENTWIFLDIFDIFDIFAGNLPVFLSCCWLEGRISRTNLLFFLSSFNIETFNGKCQKKVIELKTYSFGQGPILNKRVKEIYSHLKHFLFWNFGINFYK